MKTVFAVLMVLVATMAMAQTETQTYNPVCSLTCPEVTIPACPDCNVNCTEAINVLPGLWEVTLQGGKRCGTITVYGGGSAIVQDEGGRAWFLLSKAKTLTSVLDCR